MHGGVHNLPISLQTSRLHFLQTLHTVDPLISAISKTKALIIKALIKTEIKLFNRNHLRHGKFVLLSMLTKINSRFTHFFLSIPTKQIGSLLIIANKSRMKFLRRVLARCVL
jgi:hypothetical protein